MGVDITIIAEPRFSGGTAAAIISDVHAFSRLGLSVGLLPVSSGFFDGAADQPNAEFLALPDLPGVTLMSRPVTTDLAFFHHPLAFFHGAGPRHEIRANKSFVVAHHPPFRGDGSLEYDPIATNLRIRAAFGCTPSWAPVSGVVRTQLRSFTPLISLTSDDWVNAFDCGEWQTSRPAFDGDSAVVGRHGRADPLKWPDNPADIMLPLTPGPDWTTRIMGCPTQALQQIGADTDAWTLLAFNAVPVRDFVDSLDAFSYFYHPRWVEAFGRTIAEAILMERPCVLDPRLAPTFGTLADYCAPADAPARLDQLRHNRIETRALARTRRARAVELFDTTSIASRITALQQDRGTRSRSGPKTASIPVVLRKLAGLARRRMAGAGHG